MSVVGGDFGAVVAGPPPGAGAAPGAVGWVRAPLPPGAVVPCPAPVPPVPPVPSPSPSLGLLPPLPPLPPDAPEEPSSGAGVVPPPVPPSRRPSRPAASLVGAQPRGAAGEPPELPLPELPAGAAGAAGRSAAGAAAAAGLGDDAAARPRPLAEERTEAAEEGDHRQRRQEAAGGRTVPGRWRDDPRPCLGQSSSRRRADTKASWGTSTRPIVFIFFLPSFCFSSSLRFRLMSPP